MGLPTTAVARQWVSSNHVDSPTGTNETIALILYAVSAEML
jgi:hypothetical protein